ncbi:MAG: acyltransferase family protein [Devosia sp.]
MQHRHAIDGLRAVAVLPVIVFHAAPQVMAGGFVGVDVFFVISGYLIAGLLIEELKATGTVNIPAFYERRARRILPALVVVMAACAVLGFFVLLPSELRELGRQIIYTALFSSDFLRIGDGYFAASNELQPLFHTWSLSVEEQFYLVFPLALMLLYRFAPRRLTTWLVAIAAASLLASCIFGPAAPESNFYSSASRAWELLAGAICASVARPVQRPALALVGLVAVLVSFVAFDSTVLWPSVFALVPVVGTALILLHGTERGMVSRFLSLPPLVEIGLMSYSAYLIHQPLFAFARVLGFDGPWIMVALALLTFVLAALSLRFVERPWRRRRSTTPTIRRRLLAGCAAVLLLFGATGATADLYDGFPGRLPSEVNEVLARKPDGLKCTPSPPDLDCVYGNAKSAHVAIVGDSHAASIGAALGSAVLAQGGSNTIALTNNGCPPIVGFDRVDQRGTEFDCLRKFERFIDILERHPEIEVVVLFARWTMWTELSPFDNGEGGIEDRPQVVPALDGVIYRRKSPEYLAALSQGLVATAQRIESMGKRVIVVGSIPESGWDVPRRMVRQMLRGEEGPLTTSFDVFSRRSHDGRGLVASVPASLVVDPTPLFCDKLTGRCLNEANGVPLYRDDNHLSFAGATLLASKVAKAVISAGRNYASGLPL